MQSDIYFSNTQRLPPLKTNGLSQTVGIAYIGNTFFDEIVEGEGYLNYRIDRYDSVIDFNNQLSNSSMVDLPYALLIEMYNDDELRVFNQVKAIRENALTSGIIVILLSSSNKTELHQKALEAKANDIYFKPFNAALIFERISFLIRFKLLKPHDSGKLSVKATEYKMPLGKRLFDIFVSSVLLLLLCPLFILIAVLIKLESRGPVVYKSKRAGSGYKIFDFYKFRSMVADADKKLAKLSQTNNQYASGEEGGQKAFVKILNDPRITRFGNFLRKTSIDELPQLINVLKGDMSIVGNRPLPLYEAEQLTSDEFAMRFLGPAGITGLWQISKRGKAEMSESERKLLDNTYAKDGSFLMDLKIIFKTIPAMLQKEKV
ncbi:sugar transferase [Niabella yanshanensis]|uniref:Sugar transferase n=1 Tax=Niabella yanshanensis TaxID=577386 RepID=A0ABZ0WAS7_9BACT|nr:sugar transferase [Niabella yanshanensis]WQD39658.1 sugar transferase [Niabella yanshanensis]